MTVKDAEEQLEEEEEEERRGEEEAFVIMPGAVICGLFSVSLIFKSMK